MREWRKVVGWEKYYEVSDDGLVRSVDREVCLPNGVSYIKKGRIRKQIMSQGYLRVCLYSESKIRSFAVHRIVAESFLDNPYNLEQVNHKNGDKTDNSVNNLEWVSRTENALHSAYVLNNNTGKPKVAVLCEDKNYVFISIGEAERITGIPKQHISDCVKGKRKTAGGLHWRKVLFFGNNYKTRAIK